MLTTRCADAVPLSAPPSLAVEPEGAGQAGGGRLTLAEGRTEGRRRGGRIRLVRLPHPPPAFDLQGRPQAPAVAEGVDALEVAQVQKLPVLLRSVADDGDLAGTVALGEPPSSSRLSPPLLRPPCRRAAGWWASSGKLPRPVWMKQEST